MVDLLTGEIMLDDDHAPASHTISSENIEVG